MRSRLPQLTYPNVVASLALFIALGGISWAAVNLPANSVGTKHLKRNAVTSPKIKRNAVTSPKVKNRSLRAVDFAQGQLPSGPRGPRGATGATGDAGTAVAYARVLSDGTVDATRSSNITGAMVTHPAAGVYCFDLSSINTTVKSLVVTPEPVTANPTTQSDKFATGQVGIPGDNTGLTAGCQPGTEAYVITWDVGAGGVVNWFFNVWFED